MSASTSTSTSAPRTLSLSHQLDEIRNNARLCKLPTPAEAYGLVLEAIKGISLPQVARDGLTAAWKAGDRNLEQIQGRINQKFVEEAKARDAQLWSVIEKIFEKEDKQKYGADLHTRLSKMTDWTPGEVLDIHNWSTTSKDPKNPDASPWDKGNETHFSVYTMQAGMRLDGCRTMDWWNCRFNNKYTGKDPMFMLSPEFLHACDEWAMHRIMCTIRIGGTILLSSSACRIRFFALVKKYSVELIPCAVSTPVLQDQNIVSSFYFARYGQYEHNRAAKVFIKASLGFIDRPASGVNKATADSAFALAQASAQGIFGIRARQIMVHLVNGRTGEGDLSFFCQLTRLAKLERETGRIMKTQDDCLLEGVNHAWLCALLRYKNYFAQELDELNPPILSGSIIAGPATIHIRHVIRTKSVIRPLVDLFGNEIVDEEGDPVVGRSWEQGAISALKIRPLVDKSGAPLLDAEGMQRYGNGFDQMVVKSRETAIVLRPLRDVNGELLRDDKGNEILGTGYNQNLVSSWETRTTLRPLTSVEGSPLLLPSGDQLIGTSYQQAAIRREPGRQSKLGALRPLVDAAGQALVDDEGEQIEGSGWAQAEIRRYATKRKVQALNDASGNPLLDDDGNPIEGDGYKQASITGVATRKVLRPLKDANGADVVSEKGAPILVSGYAAAMFKAGNVDPGYTTAAAATLPSGESWGKDSKIRRSFLTAESKHKAIEAGTASRPRLQKLYWAADAKGNKAPVKHQGEYVMGTVGDQIGLTGGNEPLWFKYNAAGPFIRWFPEDGI